MNRRRHRFLAGLGVLLAAAIALASTPLPARAQAAPAAPAPQASEPLYQGTDPNRNLQAYQPGPLEVVEDLDALARETDRRAIRLLPGTIELVQGARVLRRIPLRVSGAVPFERIARAVDDRDWVEETAPGEFLLRSALAQAPGTSLTVAAPGTKVLRLADRPHVFVGGFGAQARFDGVSVIGWDEEANRPDEGHTDGRPFIFYKGDSQLDIRRAEISYLGYDRAGAYGLTWREGADGSVLDSQAHHLFFGLYTYESLGLVVRRSVFRDNVYYGIDPHDRTAGMVVEDNEAYRNGSHGIIFSRGVVDGVVQRNRVHDNGGNGIVLDDLSDRNRVVDNVSERNARDGIVILGSNDVVVAGNTVRDNRVGVRVNQRSEGNLIEGNTIVGNERGVELYGGAYQTSVRDNAIRDSQRQGMVLETAESAIEGNEISGSPTGVEIRGRERLSGTVVTGAERAVRVTPTGIAELDGVRLQASGSGVDVEPGGVLRVRGSLLEALRPLAGEPPREQIGNRLVTPLVGPAWLPLAGVTFLLLAIALQLMHRYRNRAFARLMKGPRGVWNT